MSYKIIFSDIDGTLLNKERELSSLTREVFHQLDKEVPVILISSRMPKAMRHLQDELKIAHQPLICYNGGLVIVDGKTVHSTEIPLSTIERLQQFNQNIKCHVSLYHHDEWYVPEMDNWAEREKNNTKVVPTVKPAIDVIDHWKKEKKGAHKIMCMGEENQVDEISQYLSSNFGNELHLYRSKPTYLEIANKEVSKLTGINILLEDHFHFNLEEVIAFGDNFNDYEMLKAVGMGIAVGNAKPEILEIAKEVTHHGKEDGVAKSLQKLFNLT